MNSWPALNSYNRKDLLIYLSLCLKIFEEDFQEIYRSLRQYDFHLQTINVSFESLC